MVQSSKQAPLQFRSVRKPSGVRFAQKNSRVKAGAHSRLSVIDRLGSLSVMMEYTIERGEAIAA